MRKTKSGKDAKLKAKCQRDREEVASTAAARHDDEVTPTVDDSPPAKRQRCAELPMSDLIDVTQSPVVASPQSDSAVSAPGGSYPGSPHTQFYDDDDDDDDASSGSIIWFTANRASAKNAGDASPLPQWSEAWWPTPEPESKSKTDSPGKKRRMASLQVPYSYAEICGRVQKKKSQSDLEESQVLERGN